MSCLYADNTAVGVSNGNAVFPLLKNWRNVWERRPSGNKLSPRGRRDDMPRPTAVRLAADLRPSADGSAVRTSLVAGQLQAASVA